MITEGDNATLSMSQVFFWAGEREALFLTRPDGSEGKVEHKDASQCRPTGI